MKTQINTKFVLAILISFILGAGVMHYSGRNYMDHGFGWKMSENKNMMDDGNMMKSGDHMMQDGSMMQNGGMSMDEMMNSMNASLVGKSGTELEKAFLTEMIPHHQGAVKMAETVLADKTITNKDIIKLANDIVTSQNKEISEMKNWLTKY